VACHIRSLLDEADNYEQQLSKLCSDNSEPTISKVSTCTLASGHISSTMPTISCPSETLAFGHVMLGSWCKPQSFAMIEGIHQSDIAFHWFRLNLADFLSDFLPAQNILLPHNQQVTFTPTDLVSLHLNHIVLCWLINYN
jgi:hypothetical protein